MIRSIDAEKAFDKIQHPLFLLSSCYDYINKAHLLWWRAFCFHNRSHKGQSSHNICSKQGSGPQGNAFPGPRLITISRLRPTQNGMPTFPDILQGSEHRKPRHQFPRRRPRASPGFLMLAGKHPDGPGIRRDRTSLPVGCWRSVRVSRRAGTSATRAVNLGEGLPTPEQESGLSVLPKVEVLEGELRLNDTRGLDTGAQHILFRGHVARGYQALQV